MPTKSFITIDAVSQVLSDKFYREELLILAQNYNQNSHKIHLYYQARHEPGHLTRFSFSSSVHCTELWN